MFLKWLFKRFCKREVDSSKQLRSQSVIVIILSNKMEQHKNQTTSNSCWQSSKGWIIFIAYINRSSLLLESCCKRAFIRCHLFPVFICTDLFHINTMYVLLPCQWLCYKATVMIFLLWGELIFNVNLLYFVSLMKMGKMNVTFLKDSQSSAKSFAYKYLAVIIARICPINAWKCLKWNGKL